MTGRSLAFRPYEHIVTPHFISWVMTRSFDQLFELGGLDFWVCANELDSHTGEIEKLSAINIIDSTTQNTRLLASTRVPAFLLSDICSMYALP